VYRDRLISIQRWFSVDSYNIVDPIIPMADFPEWAAFGMEEN
jgi:hypothetical protein